MAEIKRSTLFGKLNPVGYKSIEAATIFCKMRGNAYVETVHWLHQLLQQPDSDVLRIIKHFGLDTSRLATDLVAALDRLPRGATAISDFSPHIETALQQAYLYSSLLFGEYQALSTRPRAVRRTPLRQARRRPRRRKMKLLTLSMPSPGGSL